MAKIAPSILSADFVNLERDIRALSDHGADLVHVDIMDGIFVPNISIGIPVVAAIRRITDLPLDVHLMIDRPIRYVEQFVEAGADYLTIHVEADQPQNTLEALDKIHALGCKAGIVLKPKTPAEAAIPYLEKCDMILVMTVEPGFGGQKFMADMMPKVTLLKEEIRKRNLNCLIEVDGGIDNNTHITCKNAGADVLVAGSAYFNAVDKAAFARLIQGKFNERKNAKLELTLRPTTKYNFFQYATYINDSPNNLVQQLLDCFLDALDIYEDLELALANSTAVIKTDSFDSKKMINNREKKTVRLQLCVRPSTKLRLAQYATKFETSSNDLVHQLLDRLLV